MRLTPLEWGLRAPTTPAARGELLGRYRALAKSERMKKNKPALNTKLRILPLTTRFETPPGEQAQADWAEAGRYQLADGSLARIFLFVMVLGFCRALYIEFTRAMRLESLIRCHQNAFAYFGGWPERILYDNMRQVIVRPGLINPRFRDFAHYQGFEPRAHRPYRPRTKGKVERMVGYVKDNFLAARTFHSLEDLNAQGRAWLDTVANRRIHATTGARPVDLLEQERLHLTPLSAIAPYQIVHSVHRTVDAEALVRFDNVRYSVPALHAGQRVDVEAACGKIRIRLGQMILAEHPRSSLPQSRVEDPAHVLERQPSRRLLLQGLRIMAPSSLSTSHWIT